MPIIARVEIPEWVDQELQNWARWCWAGALPHPLPATHCGSLEADYRAPPQWGEDDRRRAPTIPCNTAHARIVQGAWEAMDLWERLVLKAEYPEAMEARKVLGRDAAAVRLKLTLGVYEHLLGVAAKKVEEAFNEVSA